MYGFRQFLYHCLYNETYNPPVAPVAAAALPPEAENASSRTGKHSGPEGRNSAKIEPKKSLTSLLKNNKTIVLDKVLWFSTNFYTTVCTMRHTNPPVAPVAAAALPPEAENAPSRTGKEAENAPSRTGKHSGPEGRNSAKIEPKKSLTSLLKP